MGIFNLKKPPGKYYAVTLRCGLCFLEVILLPVMTLPQCALISKFQVQARQLATAAKYSYLAAMGGARNMKFSILTELVLRLAYTAD